MTYVFVELDTEFKAQSIEFFSRCPVSRPAHILLRMSKSVGCSTCYAQDTREIKSGQLDQRGLKRDALYSRWRRR